MKSIIYPSRIKDSNIGDTLINVLLIREISKYAIVYLDGPNFNIEYYSKLNNEFKSNIKVVSGISLFFGKPVIRWFNFLNKLNNISFVFDPPGHYSQGNNFFKFVLKTFKYSIRVFFLKLMGIHCLRIGITLGPYSGFGWNFQMPMFKMYSNIAIRDLSNFQFVCNKGVPNVSFVDDLAFLLQPKLFSEFSINEKIYSESIILSFRTSVEGNNLDFSYINQIIHSLALLIKNLSNYKSFKFLIVYQVKEDYNFIPFLEKLMISLNLNYEIIQNQLNLKTAIDYYSKSNLVFTNRLHVSLLALLCDTNTIVVTDRKRHHKISNLFDDWKLNDMVYDISVENFKINMDNVSTSLDSFKNISFQKKVLIQDKLKNIIV